MLFCVDPIQSNSYILLRHTITNCNSIECGTLYRITWREAFNYHVSSLLVDENLSSTFHATIYIGGTKVFSGHNGHKVIS